MIAWCHRKQQLGPRLTSKDFTALERCKKQQHFATKGFCDVSCVVGGGATGDDGVRLCGLASPADVNICNELQEEAI